MTDTLRDSLQAALGAPFQLGRELGGGGMSRVFLARDTTFGQAKRDADAARLLDRALPTVAPQIIVTPLMLKRAEIAERLGDRATARKWYARVVANWAGGDAPVQGTVVAARTGLARVR